MTFASIAEEARAAAERAARAEQRAAAVLRSWLTAEQAGQLDAYAAFKVYSMYSGAERVFALVLGSNLVYYPACSMAYGWFPASPMPPSDALLCQALALSSGAHQMMMDACQWPRGNNPGPLTASNGPAWRAVDRLILSRPALW